MLEHGRLSNGATVLFETVQHSEVIAIGFWFLHGSRDETPDERGCSHFLEHMIFKGTAKRNLADIAREIDRVGGAINAATEKEITSVYTSVPREHFSFVLDVMCDLAFCSTLPEEEIEKEKLVVQNEISSVEDSPEEKGFELFLEQIWNGHPLAEKIAGTPESIRRITHAKLERFYKMHFVPSRLVISVAGNFDPPFVKDELEKKIDEYSRSGHREATALKRSAPVFLPGIHFVEDVFSQAQVFLAMNFPPPKAARDYYVHLVLSTAFGESMSSRLFQSIREKEGLCYSVYSSRSYHSDTALWLLYASTLPDLVEKLLASLARELAQLKKEPLSQKEIDEACLQIKGSLILSKQDVEVRMKRLARQYIAMGEILSYEDCFRLIESITKNDIEGLGEAILSQKVFHLLVFGCKGLEKLKSDRFGF